MAKTVSEVLGIYIRGRIAGELLGVLGKRQTTAKIVMCEREATFSPWKRLLKTCASPLPKKSFTH